MVDESVVREWLDKADEDYWFGRANLEEARGFFAQICFHFQQATEKNLKAFIVSRNLGFQKIHDLVALLGVCRAADASFEGLSEDCEYLAPFYVETRYPVHWPTQYSAKEAEHAATAAARVRSLVRERPGAPL